MNYGNLAYKLPEREPEPRKKERETVKKVQKKSVNNKKKVNRRKREQMAVRAKILRRICVIAVIALSAGFMISQFVTVNEGGQRIASLQKKLADEEAVTSRMIFDMEQSVDLSEIEKLATTRLGMQRPEKYQMIYVNVRQDDRTDKTAGEVESFGNRISSMFDSVGSHIVGFFSIK